MLMIFLLIAIFATGGLAIYTLLNLDKKAKGKTANSRVRVKTGGIKISTYMKWYRRIDGFFMTRGGLRRVHQRLSELSIMSSQDIKISTVKFYAVTLGISTALVVLGTLMFQDVFSTLLIILYAIIMKNTLIDKQLDAIHFKLLKQLSMAFSSVRQNYLIYGSISDSIAEAEVGPLLTRAFEEIYLILTSENSEQRLDEFYASTPFKLLCTFAGVCYKLNDSGDTRMQDGSYTFVQAMSMMANEVNLEIRRVTLQKSRFGLLEFLPLTPMLAVGVIENFFTQIIPGTAIVYQGAIGYLSKTVIVLLSIVGYTTISRINSVVSVKLDDRNSIVRYLLLKPWYVKLVKNIQPKKTVKLRKKMRVIKGSLSRTDLTHLYGFKLFMASVTLVGTIVSAFFMVYLGKEFIYNNTHPISLISSTPMSKSDENLLKKIDADYLANKKKPTVDETQKIVKVNFPKLQQFDMSEQVDRLQEKYDLYHNTTFKWWILLICYGITWGAWNVPELLLMLRAWLLRSESEEDVLQLQTIIAILMNTPIDTMDTLYWMERQSRVHKNALLDAYHSYPSDPEKSLDKLKSTDTLPEFVRMIDKLKLTIHQITLAEAFSDLISERDHVLRIREISQVTTLNRKRTFMSPLAMGPLLLTAILYILVPLAILGVQQFLSVMSGIKGGM